MFLTKLLKHTMAIFLCLSSSHECGYISSMERSFQWIKKKKRPMEEMTLFLIFIIDLAESNELLARYYS